LDIGSLQPDVWAALWPVDPGRYQPVDLSGRHVNRSNRPIWVSAGESARQHISSFCGMWGAVNLDRAANAPDPTRVYEDRGLDHVLTATVAYRESVIYNWLLTHPLP
jgi:hypothetical protein